MDGPMERVNPAAAIALAGSIKTGIAMSDSETHRTRDFFDWKAEAESARPRARFGWRVNPNVVPNGYWEHVRGKIELPLAKAMPGRIASDMGARGSRALPFGSTVDGLDDAQTLEWQNAVVAANQFKMVAAKATPGLPGSDPAATARIIGLTVAATGAAKDDELDQDAADSVAALLRALRSKSALLLDTADLARINTMLQSALTARPDGAARSAYQRAQGLVAQLQATITEPPIVRSGILQSNAAAAAESNPSDLPWLRPNAVAEQARRAMGIRLRQEEEDWYNANHPNDADNNPYYARQIQRAVAAEDARRQSRNTNPMFAHRPPAWMGPTAMQQAAGRAAAARNRMDESDVASIRGEPIDAEADAPEFRMVPTATTGWRGSADVRAALARQRAQILAALRGDRNDLNMTPEGGVADADADDDVGSLWTDPASDDFDVEDDAALAMVPYRMGSRAAAAAPSDERRAVEALSARERQATGAMSLSGLTMHSGTSRASLMDLRRGVPAYGTRRSAAAAADRMARVRESPLSRAAPARQTFLNRNMGAPAPNRWVADPGEAMLRTLLNLGHPSASALGPLRPRR